jgi:uncharacterized protein (DUF2249 family)
MDSSDLQPALELDVRPLFAAHQPPMAAILDTVGRLAPGQAFRLIAPFEPLPLYQLLAQHGLKPSARVRDDGAWEIMFRQV